MTLGQLFKKLDLFKAEPGNAFTIADSYQSQTKDKRIYLDKYGSWSGVCFSIIAICMTISFGANKIQQLMTTEKNIIKNYFEYE